MAFDDFDRPNSTTLGGQWIELEFGTGVFRILSGRLVLSGGGGFRGLAYYNVPFGDQQFSELKFISIDPSAETFMLAGPGIRLQSDSTADPINFRGYVATMRSSFVYLHRVTGDPATAVALASASHTRLANDTIQVLSSASVLEVLINGAQKILASDSTFLTGYAGCLAWDSPGFSIDFDDWRGGGYQSESPTITVRLDPTNTREAGGGLHEFLNVSLPITIVLEDWQREHVRLGPSLWSGSSEALMRPQQAESLWHVESIAEEEDRFVFTPRTHTVRSGVKIT